jgi:hypothetical protein
VKQDLRGEEIDKKCVTHQGKTAAASPMAVTAVTMLSDASFTEFSTSAMDDESIVA